MNPLADGLNAVARNTAAERPSEGKRVRIDVGRRAGATGIVRRHIHDRFSPWKWQYGSDAQAMLREIVGKFGFRVQVETETHGTFWIDAEKVTVIETTD